VLRQEQFKKLFYTITQQDALIENEEGYTDFDKLWYKSCVVRGYPTPYQEITLTEFAIVSRIHVRYGSRASETVKFVSGLSVQNVHAK
jgi:hypothetical protein